MGSPSELSGDEFERLQAALLSAFPTRDDLALMVKDGLNENLEAIAAPASLSVAVFALIRWAQAQGRLDELVAAARKENSGNTKLSAFAEELAKRKPEPIVPPAKPGTSTRVKAALGAVGLGLGLIIGGVWAYHSCREHAPVAPLTPVPPAPVTPTSSARMTPALAATSSTPELTPGYRGYLRNKTSGKPIDGARLVLQGTSCSSTTKFGVFSFEGCEPGVAARMLNPRASITLNPELGPGARDCQDVKLLSPPLMTEIRLDPSSCDVDAVPMMGVFEYRADAGHGWPSPPRGHLEEPLDLENNECRGDQSKNVRLCVPSGGKLVNKGERRRAGNGPCQCSYHQEGNCHVWTCTCPEKGGPHCTGPGKSINMTYWVDYDQ
jgi:hypothetical protein